MAALALPAEGGTAPESGDTVNWQPDGTYVLNTADRHSIRTYYRDLGMGELHMPEPRQLDEMSETCLTLGQAWRPLGILFIPESGSDELYPMELCYYSAPNPERVARIKCAHLGLSLLENRAARREIVCGRAAEFDDAPPLQDGLADAAL